jgi:hypothetical protein
MEPLWTHVPSIEDITDSDIAGINFERLKIFISEFDLQEFVQGFDGVSIPECENV